MIKFANCFSEYAPLQIEILIQEKNSEGWRPYKMALVLDEKGNKLVEFEHTLSVECIERWQSGLSDIASQKIEEFNFEPLEPAFSVNISRLDSERVEMLWIVDISYVQGGPATETGVGFKIYVETDEVKKTVVELMKL
ncbi:hypothetical protein Cylst_3391 [Cylindrospermum stagnale PCC 7417]|uniref:Uncharacterized protein n=1 Tax=Cylindrospermum stagnale PCC 7417 TaxID=56107 RepID=K9X0G0_9NOST|nr:hypothetical protein [Cylindrospermum stagnale]AFZ25541.1 hypothetical protein Cylst_3391 [Cylindrospermum stagnale PCC 7417]